MANLDKLNVDSLDAFFDFLEQQHDIVVWIRSPDYKNHLYVSKTYETICQRPVQQLYDYPDAVLDFVVTNDQRYTSLTSEKLKDPKFDGHSMFRMVTPDTSLLYVQQTAFELIGLNNQSVGVMGIAKHLSVNQWDQEVLKWEQGAVQSLVDPQKQEVLSLLKSDFQAKAVPLGEKIEGSATQTQPPSKEPILMHQNRPISLTARERQCLELLMRGFSAKQMANQLYISPRTVEYHLDNIKGKSYCRTQLELLSKIIQSYTTTKL